MALQYSQAVVNAKLDAIETIILTSGAAATLVIRSGAPPATCATGNSGTALATINLPSGDFMAAASGGAKAKTGTWQDTSADATGTAAHFRIYDSAAVCHVQGTVGVSGTDMIVDSVSFTAGQSFTINSFTITSGNFP